MVHSMFDIRHLDWRVVAMPNAPLQDTALRITINSNTAAGSLLSYFNITTNKDRQLIALFNTNHSVVVFGKVSKTKWAYMIARVKRTWNRLTEKIEWAFSEDDVLKFIVPMESCVVGLLPPWNVFESSGHYYEAFKRCIHSIHRTDGDAYRVYTPPGRFNYFRWVEKKYVEREFADFTLRKRYPIQVHIRRDGGETHPVQLFADHSRYIDSMAIESCGGKWYDYLSIEECD